MSSRIVVFAPLAVILLCIVPLAANDPKEWSSTDVELLVHKVTFKVLHVNPVVRGTVEPLNNGDVKSEVKRGARIFPKITWVAENGSKVQQGDLVVAVDDTLMREAAASQRVALDKAIGELAEAEELCKEEMLESDLTVKAVESALESARVQRKSFDGDAEALRNAVKSRLTAAEADLALWRERVAVAEKNLTENPLTDVLGEAVRQRQKAAALVDKAKAELEVLEKSTLPQCRKALDANVEEAKRWLELERQDATDRTTEAKAKLELARTAWTIQVAEYADRLEQIQNCKMYAPYTGVVFYVVPERGSGLSPTAEGEPVQYGQKLMSIPDVSRLVVGVHISEQFIHHVKEGQAATVRIDGLPNKTYKAHLKYVVNVAAANDWMSNGPKRYYAWIEIDDAVDCLNYKPNMSAEATIVTEPADVLAVPLQAIIPSKEEGKNPRCLLPTRGGPEEREVELGASDGKWVEIKSGLKEGDDVLLNPRNPGFVFLCFP
jgi:multidrug efflux pump subunit AcrA (membrane-fusion protein)